VEAFEPRRHELLAQVEAAGRSADARALFEVIYLPIAEAADEHGRHTYAALLLQFMTRSQYELGLPHPGWADDSAASKAAALLLGLNPALDKTQAGQRITQLSGLFLNALVERDIAVAHGRSVAALSLFLADLFCMMAAAFSAPVAAMQHRDQ
jgi:hypothetical protein